MIEAVKVEELEPLFNPSSIAVIGATNNPNKWGFSTFSSTLNGFEGMVYPVNNREDEVLGHKAYQRVTDIPGRVDLAIFVIPAFSIPLVMEDCVSKGIRAGIIITAGFGEIGDAGKKLQDEVLQIATRGGLHFVGPNCMGLWSATSNLRAFMFPMLVKDGPLAFVSQGGNIGAATVVSAYQRGVGFRRYVSCGCATDLQIEDYVEYFGNDPEVKVILAYIEGLNDGRRFIEKVKHVTRQKPVIVLKPGKTDAAAKAIGSHSGALAGSSTAYNAAFRKAGVIRVESPEELLDVALGFLTQPLPRGRNVAIITPGGSYGVLCADACAVEGLNIIKLPNETISLLDRIFPPRWSRGNPIDPAGDRNLIAYLTAPEKILTLDEVDSLIFMGFGGLSPLGSSFSDILPLMFPFSEDLEKRVSLITQLVKCGDVTQIGQVVRSTVDALSPFIGGRDGAELDDFTRTLTAAIASGEIDMSLLGRAPTEEVTPGAGVKEDSRRTATLNEGIDSFMGGLIQYWVRSYGKPLISTTFTEGVSHLMGTHFAYPSGERAARVLSKLIEYSEYLQREGIKVQQ